LRYIAKKICPRSCSPIFLSSTPLEPEEKADKKKHGRRSHAYGLNSYDSIQTFHFCHPFFAIYFY
jgi:hypothetical protein